MCFDQLRFLLGPFNYLAKKYMFKTERSFNPLLLPSGNVALDAMERLLSKSAVATDVLEVYTTIPHPKVEENLRAVLQESTPRYLVYFSPSGVHTSYPILKEALDLEDTKV